MGNGLSPVEKWNRFFKIAPIQMIVYNSMIFQGKKYCVCLVTVGNKESSIKKKEKEKSMCK